MPVYDYIYSVPYLFFFFFLVGLAFYEFWLINQGKSKVYLRFILILAFILFIGLRGFMYTDVISYYKLFDTLPSLWNFDWVAIENLEERREWGFLAYMILVKSVFPDYLFFQLVSFLIDIFVLDYFFRRYAKYYALGFIIFFIFSGLIIEVNLMRNVKAILLFLYSIRFVEERKPFYYILVNLCGCLFHISSLFYIPLYWLLVANYPKYFLYFVFVAVNVVYLFQISFVAPLLLFMGKVVGGQLQLIVEAYLASDVFTYSRGISIGYLERFFTALLILLYYKNMSARMRIFANLFLLYFVSYSLFSDLVIMIQRFSLLFIIGYWIVIPYLYSTLKNYRYKWIFFLFIVGYGSIKLLMGQRNILMEYHHCFFDTTTIEAYQNKVYTYLNVLVEY